MVEQAGGSLAITVRRDERGAPACPGQRAPRGPDHGRRPRVRLSGLHGTPVDRIARRVGVAQPYVFSLFPSKRDLFLAALERSFDKLAETFGAAARAYREGRAPGDCQDTLEAMGRAYIELLERDRDYLMLQHQAYAACAADEHVRERVRHRFAQLVGVIEELSGADSERLDEFVRQGMALERGRRPRRRGSLELLPVGPRGARSTDTRG